MDRPTSDKSLLDRLNALKPTTVSLDTASKSGPASTIEPAKPASKEDALSERLKSLRERVDPENQPQAGSISSSADSGIPPSSSKDKPPAGGGGDDPDVLLDTDEQTLEELLADLQSDEQWLEEVAAEVTRSKEEEHRRVTSLLEDLGNATPDDQEQTESDFRKGKSDHPASDDDSDGEGMKREATDILAQAMDQAEWETAHLPKEQRKTPEKSHSVGQDPSYDPFSLPTVPLDLQDQPDIPDTAPDDADFEAAIASRMAALKGLGGTERTLPSAPTSQVDELGLPVAPTFAPSDRPVTGVYKRYGYSDEDEKTWCTVCLEDGAVRCFGCDDDIYCARCWKEMHVGPSAGFDERGHQWEKFVKNR
ncbi:uncharacterized protein JN550_003964 [Neoarthrinium moseri]|uniref:uncharacterized protein n=1 Tax=Neoarthrinium moseri TaxID=1658444 RepID=UPI001FDAD7D1|nr:uncharacterized protein JN550_003964 [Neoarthrinium moseri]KAI1872245.1 hypothetical protein JN550_003964 [Neoarthrinium moseri]